jgi:hypothetical protein
MSLVRTNTRPFGQVRRLENFSYSEEARIETARELLTADRHRELYMVQAFNPHNHLPY